MLRRIAARRVLAVALVAFVALGAAGGALASVRTPARGSDDDTPPRGTLYVANLRTTEVAAIEIPGGALRERMPLPGGAHELVETNGGLFATVYRAGAFARIAPSPELMATPARPHGAAALLDGSLLLTLGHDDAVAAFTTDGRELWRAAVGREPHAVALGPDGRAYVANAGDSSVSVVDLGERRETGQHAVGATPESVSVSDDGIVYVANAGSGTVSAIDVRTGRASTVAVGGRPVRVVALRRGGALAAVQGEQGRLVALDRSGVRWSVAIGAAPDGIALDPEERWAFVAENRTSVVAVVDLKGQRVRSRFSAGDGPSGLLFRPLVAPK